MKKINISSNKMQKAFCLYFKRNSPLVGEERRDQKFVWLVLWENMNIYKRVRSTRNVTWMRSYERSDLVSHGWWWTRRTLSIIARRVHFEMRANHFRFAIPCEGGQFLFDKWNSWSDLRSTRSRLKWDVRLNVCIDDINLWCHLLMINFMHVWN